MRSNSFYAFYQDLELLFEALELPGGPMIRRLVVMLLALILVVLALL